MTLDAHNAAINAHLGWMDEEAARDDARWAETLVEMGNLAFVVTHYDLQTGALMPVTTEN